jgi:hypothetical protein
MPELITAVWLWLAAESAQSIGTVVVNQLPAIIVSITGLLVAYSNLRAKLESGRKQSQSEHLATMAKVEAGNQIAEKTHEALNGTLASFKAEARLAMEAAVAAAHAAGVRQGQGEGALMTAAIVTPVLAEIRKEPSASPSADPDTSSTTEPKEKDP